ncbi:hypothetical protein [Nocardia sp. NPDC050435]|uniref:hypothetical protein n=1 Tax=Nocardia sp. NPDC050435 TaxID=3155040 RepID=UPI0033C6906F
MSTSRDCMGCDGAGYAVSDDGTHEPQVHVYPCSVCDGSGIEPPAAVKAEAQAAIEKNEATMRLDFWKVTRLRTESRQAHPQWSAELTEQADLIESAWRASDHAEHWNYLNAAYVEWREFPDTMGSLFEHLHTARAECGVYPLSETQWRSQEQARDLTGHRQQWEQQQQVNAFTHTTQHAFTTHREGIDR